MVNAIWQFLQSITSPRVLPSEVIIRSMIPPAITIISVATILSAGSVTTCMLEDGRKIYAKKQTATTPFTDSSPPAICRDFTVGTSLTVRVTATSQRRSTATHAD